MAKYSKGAGKEVKDALHEMKKGKLKSGRSGQKVSSRKQAIAIGLSEAREKGAKVPAKKGASKGASKASSGRTSNQDRKTVAGSKGASKAGGKSKSASKSKSPSRSGGSNKSASGKGGTKVAKKSSVSKKGK